MTSVSCQISFGAVALICIPWLDISATVSTFASTTTCFRQRDLLFLENYKCARLPLQALLQSLPQAALMASIIATRANVPVALLSASLALALVNVLGHAVHFLAQARLQYGGPGVSLAALMHLASDAISLQGAVQVCFLAQGTDFHLAH